MRDELCPDLAGPAVHSNNLGPFDNAFFLARAYDSLRNPAPDSYDLRKSLNLSVIRSEGSRVTRRYLLERAEPPAGLVNCAISERSFSSGAVQPAAKNGDSQVSKPAAKNDFLQFIYDSAPVVGFRVMRNDVVTVRAARNPEELAARLENAGPRGEIEYLSGKSRRRLALVAGNSPVVFRSFVTVSYPEKFPCCGKVVKKHLHALLAALRRRCGRLEYLWFLEFQRRGAPHLHLFLDHALPEPLSVMNRKAGRVRKECRVHWPSQDWLSARWFEIVGSDDEKHLRAGAAWEVIEKPDGAARYVAKESYKTFQKVVPEGFRNVGRFWGVSRGVSPDEGRMVFAGKEKMAEIFGADAMDENGNPFPVLFSGAAAYEKIRDTKDDPAKIREWFELTKASAGRQAVMIGLKSSNIETGASAVKMAGCSTSRKFTRNSSTLSARQARAIDDSWR